MIFFDTNVLVYYTINQDEEKQKRSKKLIEDAIVDGEFFISPLIMMEYIFVLSKLKILDENRDKILFFSKFIEGNISTIETMEAYKICQESQCCKNINDVVHLIVAQQYCNKLLTYDNDFKKLQKYTNIEIEIL